MPPKQGSSTGETRAQSARNTQAESTQLKAESNGASQPNKLSKDEKELFIKCLKADQRVHFYTRPTNTHTIQTDRRLTLITMVADHES